MIKPCMAFGRGTKNKLTLYTASLSECSIYSVLTTKAQHTHALSKFDFSFKFFGWLFL